jgi:hypothetical protein
MCREAARDFPVLFAGGMPFMTYQYDFAVNHGQYGRAALAGCRNGPDISSDNPITEPNGIPKEDDIGVSINKCRTCRFLQFEIENYLVCRAGQIDEVLWMRLPEIVVCDERRLTIDHYTSVSRRYRSAGKRTPTPVHNRLRMHVRTTAVSSGASQRTASAAGRCPPAQPERPGHPVAH